MTSVKLRFFFFCLAMLLVCALSACASPEKRIQVQFDTLPQIASTLLYEHGDVSFSATGDCAGTFQDRWYATTMSAENITKLYSDFLTDHGWTIRAGEVVEVWSREDNGMYRLNLDIFTDLEMISQYQVDYELSASVLATANRYPTIYRLTMFYMYPNVVKKCHGD